jgi:hypothetical protein
VKQLSVTTKYVPVKKMKITKIKSMRFLGLTSIDYVSGKELVNVTLKFLEKMNHC